MQVQTSPDRAGKDRPVDYTCQSEYMWRVQRMKTIRKKSRGEEVLNFRGAKEKIKGLTQNRTTRRKHWRRAGESGGATVATKGRAEALQNTGPPTGKRWPYLTRSSVSARPKPQTFQSDFTETPTLFYAGRSENPQMNRFKRKAF